MNKDTALRLALEALELMYACYAHPDWVSHKQQEEKILAQCVATTMTLRQAIKATLEAKDEPVGLIESLKDAQPCCGQYATCWRACTPRGKFIGQRDAQRKPLTDEEIERIWESLPFCNGAWETFARAIEAAHGIKGEAK